LPVDSAFGPPRSIVGGFLGFLVPGNHYQCCNVLRNPRKTLPRNKKQTFRNANQASQFSPRQRAPAYLTKDLLKKFGWEIVEHSLTVLTSPSDHHMLPALKKHLGGTRKFKRGSSPGCAMRTESCTRRGTKVHRADGHRKKWRLHREIAKAMAFPKVYTELQ